MARERIPIVRKVSSTGTKLVKGIAWENPRRLLAAGFAYRGIALNLKHAIASISDVLEHEGDVRASDMPVPDKERIYTPVESITSLWMIEM